MALRASRRAKRCKSEVKNEPFVSSSNMTPSPSSCSESGSGLAYAIGADSNHWGTCVGDLEEHYLKRPARNLNLLETEAAVTAVLAYDCGGCGGAGKDTEVTGVGSDDKNTRQASSACAELAAEVVVTLCKASCPTACSSSSTTPALLLYAPRSHVSVYFAWLFSQIIRCMLETALRVYGFASSK